MINELYANAFCKDDISLIENFDKASKDPSECWVCHHRMEIRPDYNNSVEELKAMGLYFHRPAGELVFMKSGDHSSLHNRNRSSKTKAAISKGLVGRKISEVTRQKLKDAWALSRATGLPRGAIGMHWHIEDGHRVYTTEVK